MGNRVGQQFGNYRLFRLLGYGGFAEVYLGEHIHIQTQAAIKVLSTHLAAKDLERFIQEARIIAHLEHPHIVHVFDFGIEDEIPFLVMNYASNGTLRQRHPEKSRVPLNDALSYVKQIASALQYAHDRKVIHRDVKPENMLSDNQGEVLLSDFGLAVTTATTTSQQSKTAAGTAGYMAPEQILGKPCAASDQYALGIILYEWLSGEQPFHGSFFETCAQHLHAPLPSLREKNPEIPLAVEQCIIKALSKDTERRFTSIQDFATALQESNQQALHIFTSAPTAPTAPTQWLSQVKHPDFNADQDDRTLPKPQSESSTLSSMDQDAQAFPNTYLNAPTLPRVDQDQLTFLKKDAAQTFHESTKPSLILPVTPSAPPNYERKPKKNVFVMAGFVLLLLSLLATPFLFSFLNGRGPVKASQSIPQVKSTDRAINTSTITVAPELSPTPKSKPTNTSTRSNAPTSTSTPIPTSTPTPTNTSTSSTQPVPFSVTGINVSVDPSNFKGACTDPMTFTFTAIIKVPANTSGGMVTYTWLRSDGATAPIETTNFSAGATTQTVTTTWQLGAVWGNGSSFWEALQVTAPNSVTSAHANFSFVCQSIMVTGINATVSPTTYDCSQSQITFSFSATINIGSNSSGGNITYTWARSDGATMSPLTITVPAGQTTVTVTDTWSLGVGAPTGTYWEQVAVSAPNSISSNQATFTKTC